jgi:hypothetical protein
MMGVFDAASCRDIETSVAPPLSSTGPTFDHVTFLPQKQDPQVATVTGHPVYAVCLSTVNRPIFVTQANCSLCGTD